MIELEEMRQLFCRTYDGLRERIVATADNWIGDCGEFIAHAWIYQLCRLVRDRLENGDYEQSVALFMLVEKLLTAGDEAVKTVVATGFLEGLQHQRKFSPELWMPLLGPLAQSYCAATDKFHGINR
ncbi:hypothetical protein [Undibacterium sp.]|uniref:DUF7674 family protein n=1 Tax=Undibacterium sp. TaxID=1914977 RepID=UPI00374DAA00